jgi:Holliday junction resolvase RusA-like endonuclease
MDVATVPPSTNHAYFNNRFGGRSPTAEHKTYKRETIAHLARSYPRELATIHPNTPYLLYFRVYLEATENAGWPKKAKFRYKSHDASNCIKLLEDALKDVAGIDDSQHMVVVIEKRQGKPRTEIFMWNLQEEVPPIGGLLGL